MSDRIERPPYPSQQHLLHVMDFMLEVAVVCKTIKIAWITNDEEVIDQGKELHQRMIAAGKAVQGNRRAGTPITWDDFRLLTAAALRVALEEMEEPE